ncbi:Uncharacterised protein [Pantoea agglomerans]|uniref:Uncharacterized protein n=1 Tax=Enterobacter agglomerans TaxID=549 RepID=A0A379LTR7_ENTAG|nr:Uncharacterised protein [Pantoea agglomerans]
MNRASGKNILFSWFEQLNLHRSLQQYGMSA